MTLVIWACVLCAVVILCIWIEAGPAPEIDRHKPLLHVLIHVVSALRFDCVHCAIYFHRPIILPPIWGVTLVFAEHAPTVNYGHVRSVQHPLPACHFLSLRQSLLRSTNRCVLVDACLLRRLEIGGSKCNDRVAGLREAFVRFDLSWLLD